MCLFYSKDTICRNLTKNVKEVYIGSDINMYNILINDNIPSVVTDGCDN